ncbi:MAG: ankyrin repeat domain-containing protein [Candidatus Eremiobacteraeota bacterium]|nr:ankyrin repeat domain-containing protein [Candidatus Eremiobacteraeota bacterium]
MPKFCPQCGSAVEDKARFCMQCGERLAAESASLLLDNRYEILATVKSGGMGCLYKARDIRLNNVVAVKQMKSAFTSEDDDAYAEGRFWEEARLLSTLHHGGLPKVIDFFCGKDPSTARPARYLVMTFIEGKDLEALRAERGQAPFPVEEVLDYFRQILSILNYLHTQCPPIVYRDMKLSNIMLSEKRIFLVDFGIARLFVPEKGGGTQAGTPGFAAPEQYKGFAEPRSDLYALGTVLYSLLTGLDPGGDPTKAPHACEKVRALNAAVPAYLEEIIGEMMEYECEKRPPSAAAIIKRLNDTLAPPAAPAPPAASAAPSAPPARVMAREPVEPPPPLADVLNAIRYRDMATIKKYINGGGDMNALSYRGLTPLHFATEKGIPEAVELLLKGGCDINHTGKVGWTSLHLTAITGDVVIAKILLANGANINAMNEEGVTPLHRAVHWGHEEFLRYLVGERADLNSADKYGVTPLIYAVIKKRVHMVKILVANGADMNCLDKSGSNALHLAAANDDHEIMKLLILGGADVNIKNSLGQAALHILAQQSYGIVADLLIAKGAEVNAKDGKGQTPLHWASQTDFSMVSFLLSHGAEVNAKDQRGTTPLQKAIAAGRRENVAILRKYGAG